MYVKGPSGHFKNDEEVAQYIRQLYAQNNQAYTQEKIKELEEQHAIVKVDKEVETTQESTHAATSQDNEGTK